MSDWRDVQWSMGGNDTFGDCSFVACANLLDLWAAEKGEPFTIGEAECERLYALEAGFNSQDPNTDKGAVLEDVLKYWCANGWPADPMNKPSRYESITPQEIPVALASHKGVVCWVQLPDVDDDNLFDDSSLSANPNDGHAMLCVAADAEGMTLITWAEPVHVSTAWWKKFGRGQFAVWP